MPTTAREHLGNLIIDFGDGTEFTIYPVPGKVGLEIQTLLVGIAMGTTLHGEGPEKAYEDTERLTKLALGVPDAPAGKRRKAPNKAQQAALQRFTDFENLRQARQQIVAQVATLWNTGGGGIEAVLDLLDEAGGYPKALGRVMASSGLGDQFELLRTWLDSAAGTSAEDSTKSPTGGPTTSA
ncbi:hypothetical protein [Leucobacter sp. GX24907]